MAFAGLAPIIGGVIGAGASLLGGVQQQQASAAQVAQQEQFQEQMSNTQYERTVTDLKAAGLNPMLAVGAGPVSSPAGSSYQPQNFIGQAASSALQSTQNFAQLDAIQAQADKTRQDKDTSLSQEALLDQQREKMYQDMLASQANAQMLQSKVPVVKAQNDYLEKNPWILQTKAFLEPVGSGINSASKVADMGLSLAGE